MAPSEAKPAASVQSTGLDRFLRRFAGFNVALLLVWTTLQFGASWNPWWLVLLTKFHVYAFVPAPLWLVFALVRRKSNPELSRRLIVLFCVPLLLWSWLYGRLWFPSSAGSPTASALSVMTYNVLNAQPDLSEAIEIVLRLDPDVICFQEVTERHAGELVARLSTRYPHRQIGSPSPGGTTALFTKSPWIESGELAFPKGRPAVWATVDSPVGKVTVVSAHLMHYWRGEIHGLGMVPEYMASRTRWQEEQIEVLIERFGREEAPVILGMDGNLAPHSRSWRMLSRDFTDAAIASGWQPFSSQPSGTSPDLRPLKLDYLWVSGLRSSLTVVANDAGGSDHRPVMGLFGPELE